MPAFSTGGSTFGSSTAGGASSTTTTTTAASTTTTRAETMATTTAEEVEGELACTAIGPYVRIEGMDEWCQQNCDHVPSFCPTSHCECVPASTATTTE